MESGGGFKAVLVVDLSVLRYTLYFLFFHSVFRGLNSAKAFFSVPLPTGTHLVWKALV